MNIKSLPDGVAMMAGTVEGAIGVGACVRADSRRAVTLVHVVARAAVGRRLRPAPAHALPSRRRALARPPAPHVRACRVCVHR
jgi:hypothetical protein